jgi:ribonuclease D
VIDRDTKLAAFLPRLSAADWVALDTEADSLHAYPEKLCLIQISLSESDDLIDPLARLDLVPLLEALQRRELILHGADYDLRLLRRTYGFVPQAVFDTMLAARLLGSAELGLNSLVNKRLGVHLEKGPQKADWARRPLTERMATYARNDTRYLKPLEDLLRGQLLEQGRLEWHRETCARLVADCAELRPPDPERIWRVKGADKLDRRGLAVLRALWHWREGEALAANKPPYFVLKHETLAALAGATAQSRPWTALLPPRLSSRRQEGIRDAVEQALALPASQWPSTHRASGRAIHASEKRRYEKFRLKRDCQAAELGIDPSLIASRAALGALAQDWDRNHPELMDWQRRLLQD